MTIHRIEDIQALAKQPLDTAIMPASTYQALREAARRRPKRELRARLAGRLRGD